jgi:hypothetical protein
MSGTKVTYRQEGFDGQAYDICEYHNSTRVFWYKGYYDYRTNQFTLYPKTAVVKGERRDKITIDARHILRGGPSNG